MPKQPTAVQKPAPAEGLLAAQAAPAATSVSAHAQAHRLQPAKLLRSKWTATVPVNKEKHFIVTALLLPDATGRQFDAITMEAVLTGRSFTLRWRELNDAAQWLQGWR
ncbi:MAG: TIGR02450 family Trp-rich protein [Pseudomonadota bacterium]